MQQQKFNITPFRIVLPIMLVFFIISAVGIFNHELWMDEAQHFLIGRDSNSLTELYYNMRYDGHVRLWNILLFFITHYISISPLAMQAFHLIIICITVFIFLRYAPFDIITKLLIISGYYFLFEYNLLSRNYALGILFLFASCKLLGREDKNLLWVGVMLILMSNTHLFFSFAACGIFLYVSYHRLRQRNFDLKFLGFSLLFVMAVTTVIIQTDIPKDNAYFHPEQMEWSLAQNISAPFYGFAKGVFPVPVANHGDFWNHFLFDKIAPSLKMPIAFFLMGYFFFLLRKSKPVLLFYACSIFLLLLFLYLGQSRASRYFGMCFIFFIAAAWLAGNESINAFSIEKLRQGSVRAKILYGFFYLILICHVFSGVYAYSNDVARPFTEAKNIVEYLKSNNLENNTIVVETYGVGPPFSAYLGRKLFYLDVNEPGSYCYFKKSYFKFPAAPLVEEMKQSSYISAQNNFLLISIRIFDSSDIKYNDKVFHLEELKRFTKSIIRPDYYLYVVTKK